MAVLAAVANFMVIEPNSADLAAWSANHPLPFALALLALFLVVALDVTVAWALRVLFQSVSPALSLLTAWFRTVYAAVFMVAIATLGISPGLAATDAPGLSFALFSSIWDAGLILFGLHLLLLAALLHQAEFTPSWLGILVGIAGLGYLSDSVIGLLAPGATISIGTFTFVGEVVLLVWLLARAKVIPPAIATSGLSRRSG